MTEQQHHFNPYITFWDDFGPPLRPDRPTVQAYGELFQAAQPIADGAQVMLMGVTPELANAPWLSQTQVTAIDHSPAMISTIWPGDRPNRKATTGDWFNLPIRPGSQDVVLGDGVLNFLTYPAEHQALAESLSCILRPGGHLIIRAFCAPQNPESPEQILRRAQRGELKNVHDFKLLLLGALQQGTVETGVELAHAWQVFHAHFPEIQNCITQTGWSIQTIRTLDLYKDNPQRYYLATPAQIETTLSPQFQLSCVMTIPSLWSSPTPLMLFQKRML